MPRDSATGRHAEHPKHGLWTQPYTAPWHSLTADASHAFVAASVASDEPCCSRPINMGLAVELQPQPAAPVSSEWAMQSHPSCFAHSVAGTPIG
mmetsp:Transcript_632/g.1332  ORF Transcript_632/g.1332 Transcript_632/m.1332 type:complete len:94 (-) Transcript_632:252-533(-)